MPRIATCRSRHSVAFTCMSTGRTYRIFFGGNWPMPTLLWLVPYRYRWREPDPRYQCDLSYMGTYAPDRQKKLEELFCKPANAMPEKAFLLAGPQYPAQTVWPKNVRRIVHLEPEFHPYFYSS